MTEKKSKKIYFLFTNNRHTIITNLEIPILGIAISMMMQAKSGAIQEHCYVRTEQGLERVLSRASTSA
jgi:hypothetical protein